MIEKLTFEITQGEYEGKKFDIKSHASPYDIQEKVNEIVDTINELQTTLDNYTKRFREREAVHDPRIHEAVKSANKKLDSELDIAIDALTQIMAHKQRLCLDDTTDIVMDLFKIAQKALNKIKEQQ